MAYTHPIDQPQEYYDRINRLIQPLVKTFGINSFSYFRCNWNGRAYNFSSHKGWTDYYYRNNLNMVAEGFPDFFDISEMCRKPFIFYDDYEQNNPFGEQVIRPMQEIFGLHHPVTYYGITVGYTWGYTMSFARDDFDGGRRLVEGRQYLKEFLMYFREQANDIYQAIKEQHYYVPTKIERYAQKKAYYQKLVTSPESRHFDTPHRYYLDEFDHSNYLTNREVECLRCLGSTTSYKEIGEKLGISQQTVQHHINAVRTKLGLANKTELLKLLRDGDLLVGLIPDRIAQREFEVHNLDTNRIADLFKKYMEQRQNPNFFREAVTARTKPPSDVLVGI